MKLWESLLSLLRIRKGKAQKITLGKPDVNGFCDVYQDGTKTVFKSLFVEENDASDMVKLIETINGKDA